MVDSNRERIGNMLESLKAGLTPYVEREMQREYGKEWNQDSARRPTLDSAALLKCIWVHWNAVFGQKLGRTARNYVSELIEVRNNWAHQEAFTLDDTDRALDTAVRLLRVVSAPQADEINRERQKISIRYEDRTERGRKTLTAKPYADLRSGRVDAGGFMQTQAVRTSRTYPICECGCGDRTAGGRFLPGHDAKLKSKLIKTARAEGENKDLNACDAAWNELVELGWSHMFDEEQTRLTAEVNRIKAARKTTKIS